jgi:hypothetical protein
MIAADGVFAITVWPSYVGLGSTSPTTGLVDEPDDDARYGRGQITWATVYSQPVGHARVFAPAGAYDHLIYCSAPVGSLTVQSVHRLPHPVVFDTDRWLDIAGITNQDQARKVL